MTPDIADAMGLKTPGGVLVADVVPDGPAAAAHLKSDDLIVSVNDEPVDDVGTLNYRLATLGVGVTATLGIVRGGKQYQTTIALEAAPETVPRAETMISGNSPVAGATVLNLSPAVADEMLYNGDPTGVIVAKVSNNTPANVAGIQRGDVIVKLNNVAIDTHPAACPGGRPEHRLLGPRHRSRRTEASPPVPQLG